MRLKIVAFPDCVVFESSYLTETVKKPLRIRLGNTFGEIFKALCNKTFSKLGTEPTLEVIFDRIKKEIDKIQAVTRNLYLIFN